MAKEDFCFTYYDGDAARDMSHMNRLERGAYTDIIISQRKFGHLTEDQIKKILGRDFQECFPAIELVLEKDEEGKYFIEWLENSVVKMRKGSRHQSDNGKKGGRPPKNKANQKLNESQSKAINNPNEEKIKPLGDEYEYEDRLKEEGMGETIKGAFSFDLTTKLPATAREAVERNQYTHTRNPNTDHVLSQWKIFLAERINDPPDQLRNFRRIEDLTKYFINWMRDKFPKKNAGNSQTRQQRNDASANWLLNSLRDDIAATGG